MKSSTMTPAQTFNDEQRARWNGIEGEYWTRQNERLGPYPRSHYRAVARFCRGSSRINNN
jgi:hypothetical protein